MASNEVFSPFSLQNWRIIFITLSGAHRNNAGQGWAGGFDGETDRFVVIMTHSVASISSDIATTVVALTG